MRADISDFSLYGFEALVYSVKCKNVDTSSWGIERINNKVWLVF